MATPRGVCLQGRFFCGLLLTVHALCNRSNGARLRCVIETTIQPPLPEMDDIRMMEGIILGMTSMWMIN